MLAKRKVSLNATRALVDGGLALNIHVLIHQYAKYIPLCVQSNNVSVNCQADRLPHFPPDPNVCRPITPPPQRREDLRIGTFEDVPFPANLRPCP